jgi:L-lactate dehydrogenase (cytochrome)
VTSSGYRQLDSVTSPFVPCRKWSTPFKTEFQCLWTGAFARASTLGAKACFVGRAWAYALGAAGESGVRDMLDILKEELRVAMILTGCSDVTRATPHLLLKN